MALAGPLSSQIFLPASLFHGWFPQSRPPSKMEGQAGIPAETKASCPASQESHRQMFRQSIVLPGETPLGTLSRLSDAAHRWLRPQEHTKEQIVDMIILEQFLSLLPVEMQVCLRARGLAGSSSKEIAQVVEAALQQQEPAEVVAKWLVNFEEPSASLSESQQASMSTKQKTLYSEVMKEIDESRSSSVVLQLSNSNTSQTEAASLKMSETGILPSMQPESIHRVSTCSVTNPDIITVKIKSESKFWQDDPKAEGNENPPWHVKEEEDNVSWYWQQQSDQQGNHPRKEEENAFPFGSHLEENHSPQIRLETEQGVVDHTSAWPGKKYISTSGYFTPEKRQPGGGQSSYMWSECEKWPPFSSDFAGHLENFTELNPSENTSSNSSVLFKHVASTARERCYICADCGDSFTCKSTLDRHWMSHTASRPHKCYECGKSFQARSTLVSHQRIHTGEKPHLCPHCGKSFRVKSSLTQHQRLHTGEKPFQCSDCGKRFNQRVKLVNHYRTHTGERPYQCFDCRKGFITRSSLVQHNERVHS